MMEYSKCPNCGHPEEDHGPESGRWVTGEVIPGRLCFYMENQGYQEDLCNCPGFDAVEDDGIPGAFKKAGIA